MTVYAVTYGCGDYYCDGEHLAGVWTDRLTAESVEADFAPGAEVTVTAIELDPPAAAIPAHLRAGYVHVIDERAPTDSIIPAGWMTHVMAECASTRPIR